MKLRAWRGNNVLVTDRAGHPVLVLDARGNVQETYRDVEDGSPAQEVPSFERLALRVAVWIEWTAHEPREFCAEDIHPSIRASVANLAREFVDVSCSALSEIESPGERRQVPPVAA